MSPLFYSSLVLACFAVSNAASVRNQNLDWSSDWQWPRKYPRYPPPPFDPEPARGPIPFSLRFPPSARKTSPNLETTTKTKTSDADDQVVLYKANCDPCLPGWGVKSMCNSTTNTVCTPCPLGTWSPRNHHYRPCEPCSKCGEASYEEQVCTTTRDTVCCSCANAKAKVNEDYVRKCVLDVESSKDTDIDIEFADAMDLNSKEFEFYFDIDKSSDSSDELPFNEDDIDRPFLWLPPKKEEIDITIDDPEIDEEEPKLKDQVNEKTTIRPGSARIPLHPIRPLPRVFPSMSERNVHVEPEDSSIDDDDDDLSAVNNFPPSYHEYSISSLVHGGDAQRRKAIVLLVLTCAIVLSTMAFVVCYVREYCRRRATMYNGVTLVTLTQEEREIMRKSAKVLEEMEKPVKKSRNGYSQMGGEGGMEGIENPLEDYLNTIDERHVARHGLIENEVTHEPRGDRKNVSA